NLINQNKSQAYLQTQLAVITPSKLHLHHLHHSQITLIPTTGSFTHPISTLLIPQDRQQPLLTTYNLSHDQIQTHKQHIFHPKFLLIPNPHPSSHNQLQQHNPPYQQIHITHYPSQSKPPKS
ncbi:hypothetical protein, partial [Staphylococcus pasteuri]|uniref:hypothetical protein n=1 Tax=Staphylococcus pasteuri TaxID=45972 RepID=UPI0012B8DF19